MVAAARAVAVEVALADLPLQQVFAGRRDLRIAPAGEMWSVVMLSASTARTRAPRTEVIGPTSIVMPSK
jgi:hypothetical protein